MAELSAKERECLLVEERLWRQDDEKDVVEWAACVVAIRDPLHEDVADEIRAAVLAERARARARIAARFGLPVDYSDGDLDNVASNAREACER